MKNANVWEVRMAELSPLLEEILASGGTAEITVTGNSMYPMLKHRKSQVRLARADHISVGDLPLYRRDNGAYILHRIIGEEDGAFVCCGDHQWHPEQPVRRDQIIAVVTHFRRGSQWISCDHPGYRRYWKFWTSIRPLRRLVFGGTRRIARFVRRTVKHV